MKYFILLTIILEIIGLIKSELILKPVKETGEDVALIIIIGALMKPSSYIPLAQEIQKASSYRLWVGIPSFIFNMPDPITISWNISSIKKEMEGLGMKTKFIFYGGHSLGATVLQRYLYGQQNVIGQIQMGSSLMRTYMSNLNKDGSSKMDYTVPTLTLNGCLDGLYRVTRVAESYYHHKLNQKNSTVVDNFPVVMVKGATHMQFSSGVPSTQVLNNDLIPEISDEEAHSTYGQIISSFMDFRMGKKADILNNFIKQTEDILNPIIEALQFEGSYHLKPPCFDKSLINR